jgi:SAM-dependent methyltransferase
MPRAPPKLGVREAGGERAPGPRVIALAAPSLRARWESAAGLIAENRDVLDARPEDGDAPHALVSRGWAAFLVACDDDELAAFEIDGLDATWPAETPDSLLSLIGRAREICAMGLLEVPSYACSNEAMRPARRRETPRKRAQVDAFARVVLPLAAHARRVVDVGSGHGHLTREIAERIALPVVGLERDVALADRARSLSSFDGSSPTFSETDVLRDGLAISEGDCVIGLHACGELGDAMIVSAARSAASVALVGCCLQKRRSLSRAPLCEAENPRSAPELPRWLLGLSNLTARDDGVEATRLENLAGRARRLALHRLLSEDGNELRLGAELEGLNRRAAHRDLPSLVARAFALRRRSPPSASAIEEAASWAREQHARVRRLSVPRLMLARTLEVFVALDRARYLEERGFAVTVGALFPASVSARNLVLAARRV